MANDKALYFHSPDRQSQNHRCRVVANVPLLQAVADSHLSRLKSEKVVSGDTAFERTIEHTIFWFIELAH